MELVLATHHLIAFAGADTYLVTVAAELERLGHDVTVHALEQGEGAERARARGVNVAEDAGALPARCDAVLAQDAIVAYELAERYPQAPQAFVCHSEVFSLDTPPQVPGVTSAVVVMSDRTARHVASLAVRAPVARLRQPIDLRRFQPAGAPRPQPERVAVIGNYMHGARRALLEEACAGRGLSVSFFGGADPPTDAPEEVMAGADIVVGKGRVILEAMACGRPALVYDWIGGDGWVTPRSYPALEADAFAGQADPAPMERGRLAALLDAYDPAMGVANRDLAVAHHDAQAHAAALVTLLGGLAAPARGERPPAAELAAAARRQWRLEAEAHQLRRRMDVMETEARQLETEARQLETEARQLRRRMDVVETEARQAHRALAEVKASRRYRVGAALTRPLDRLRRR